MTTALKVPTIHLNGSDGDRLIDALRDASDAINMAISKLKETAPHGRDYYPQGDNAIMVAIEEYRSRFGRLTSVDKELKDIMLAIQNQLDSRNTNRR